LLPESHRLRDITTKLCQPHMKLIAVLEFGIAAVMAASLCCVGGIVV
jgi:hypothetical protein